MAGVLKTSGVINTTVDITVQFDDGTTKTINVKEKDILTIAYYDIINTIGVQTITGSVLKIRYLSNVDTSLIQLVVDGSTQYASDIRTINIDWIRAVDVVNTIIPTT